jgi:hypothetical protein
MVDPFELFNDLSAAPVFSRGLLRKLDLQQEPAICQVLDTVCHVNVITMRACRDNTEQEALKKCFRMGWLHADLFADDNIGYVFASPLHRWFVERRLYKTPTIPPHADLLTFSLEVIRLFSPLNLSSTRRIGPGCVQRPPEARYQDEFYRCSDLVTKGSTVTFPEFGTSQGCVDFYIPGRKWGVELLLEDDDLAGHCGRFTNSGNYTSLDIDDFIVLNFGIKTPCNRHPGMCMFSVTLRFF